VEMRNNIALKVCLVVILLFVGLTFFGCGVSSLPQGGSGGVVADGTLFLCPTLKQASSGFSCTAASLDGKLATIDMSSGSRKGDDVTLESSSAIYGNPAVAGDLVYVGGYNGKIYAISSSTHLSTNKYLDENNPKPIVGGPVVAGDRVYIGCSDGKVYALDAASLEPVWGEPFETGGKIWSTPVIDGDTLYIGSFDKKLYALNISDGTEKWAFEAEGAIIATPLVYNGTVYIGSFDRKLYAIDATTGTAKWEEPFEAGSWFWAKPVVYNGIIYAPCLDHKVYALDAETGEKINEFDLGNPISSSPVVVGNKVIVATENGIVYAVDTDSNEDREIIRLETQQGKEETIYAPLCVSDGVVYIYTVGQNLYALNVESGIKLWSQTIK
jgi:outer membrane protein assembly factor BamB